MTLKEIILKLTDAHYEKIAKIIDEQLKFKQSNFDAIKKLFDWYKNVYTYGQFEKSENPKTAFKMVAALKQLIYQLYWGVQNRFESIKIEARTNFFILFKNAAPLNKYFFIVYEKENNIDKNFETIEIAFLHALIDFCDNWEVGNAI